MCYKTKQQNCQTAMKSISGLLRIFYCLLTMVSTSNTMGKAQMYRNFPLAKLI